MNADALIASVGANTAGRGYFKFSYKTDEGVYAYNKYSLNTPEIAATIFVAVYMPELLVVGGTVAIPIFK